MNAHASCRFLGYFVCDTLYRAFSQVVWTGTANGLTKLLHRYAGLQDVVRFGMVLNFVSVEKTYLSS